MKKEFQIETRSAGGVVIVEVIGEYHFPEEYVLGELITDEIQKGNKKFLLNLERVEWMSSTGIGDIVVCLKRVSEAGGDLKLLSPSERVVELLTMTRLIELFVVFRDEEEAIASFAPAG